MSEFGRVDMSVSHCLCHLVPVNAGRLGIVTDELDGLRNPTTVIVTWLVL